MIKQNILLTLIFTITLTLGFAQKSVNQLDSNGKRHGLWSKSFQGTNQPRYTGQFDHGKEIDTFNYYTLSQGKSVLSAVKVFEKDSDLANITFYTSTGNIISRGQMKGKLYVGKWTYYHKNSDLIMTEESFNEKGKLEGNKRVYFKNGQLAEDTYFKNGKMSDFCSWYGDKGQLLKQQTYKDDQLSGPSVYYDANNKVSSKGEYKNNEKIGVWKYYTEGVLSKEINHDTDTVKKIDNGKN